jgi:hypothetical protein
MELAVLRILALLSILGLLQASAHADEVHYSTMVGVKGVELGHLQSGHTSLATGFGVFVERSFLHHAVELELSVVAADVNANTVLPVDLLVKHAHRVSKTLSVFAGAGGSVVLKDTAPSSSGLTASVGAYYWATPHWGVDMEVDYSLLVVGGSGQEVCMAAGPVLRF